MMNYLKRMLLGTLRRQLIVGMVLVVASMMSLIVWDQTRRNQAEVIKGQSDEAAALATSVATSAAVWVASRDYSGLQDIVNSLKDYPDLRHAIVLDLKGQVLAHSDPTRRGLYMADLPSLAQPKILQSGSSLVDLASPVMLAGSHIGWVRIGLSTTAIDDRLSQLVHQGIIYTAFGIFLSALVAAATGKYLTRRLDTIQHVADAIQTGDYGARADVPGDDEAAKLARQFNNMLDTLAQREEAIQAASQYASSLIEASLDPLVTINAEGKITGVNRAMESATGVGRDALIGGDITTYFTDPKKLIEGHRDVFSQGFVTNYPLTIRHVSGKVTDVLYSASLYRGTDNQVLGILAAARDITERKQAEEALSQYRQRLEELVASRTAELARVNEELNRLARQDVLTRLPNRLAVNERLHTEFLSMKRSKNVYAVLMMDIDFFKRVNDAHGHAIGDQVLQRVAKTMQATLRESDFCGRFGGEEFLALLPATNMPAACQVAEKFRQAVEASPDPVAGRITVSIGLALATPEQADEETAVRESDEALYRAKNGGRNQVQGESEFMTPVKAGDASPAKLVQLVWRSAYECGNQTIDAQHQELFHGANRLLSAVLNGLPTQNVTALVDSFIGDVVQHFQDEETIITKAGYPAVADHAILHRALVEKASALAMRFRAGTLSLGELFEYLAQDVVTQHMLTADRKYFLYLNSSK